jgi:hypothetical protein
MYVYISSFKMNAHLLDSLEGTRLEECNQPDCMKYLIQRFDGGPYEYRSVILSQLAY